ncbi:metal ABC transporter solute-binding protein, Zn/Mn family [Leptotrichia sp. oral taxon 212]|uniref:metal ABC transporter substrate-binding protein n=1 Tax=Leptotrichia sp. oral taxon 212 TaxID=712357 RepID=UPI0006A9C06B|nr:zinc ABC transporter substrate-binding protein [Leptotrichia sp. oral taxon 212]
MKKITFILMFLLIGTMYAENRTNKKNKKVLTSIQSVYSIVKNITKDSDIEVYSIFDSDVSMDYGKSAFDNKNLDLSSAKDAVAVVDVAKVWNNDYLYEYARRKNIRIVEIDASYSFSGNDYLSLSLLNYKNGDRNPYVWMSFQNVIKMANIAADDLSELFPENSKIIEKNLTKFSQEIKEIENGYLEKTLTLSSLSVITLTENLDYLFNDLNIFFNYTDTNEVTVKNVAEIMKRNNSKIFISDRWIKKEIINEIEQKGGKFLVLDTFNIPREVDGKMDPDGYIKGMKENMEKLVEAMQSMDKK